MFNDGPGIFEQVATISPTTAALWDFSFVEHFPVDVHALFSSFGIVPGTARVGLENGHKHAGGDTGQHATQGISTPNPGINAITTERPRPSGRATPFPLMAALVEISTHFPYSALPSAS